MDGPKPWEIPISYTEPAPPPPKPKPAPDADDAPEPAPAAPATDDATDKHEYWAQFWANKPTYSGGAQYAPPNRDPNVEDAPPLPARDREYGVDDEE